MLVIVAAGKISMYNKKCHQNKLHFKMFKTNFFSVLSFPIVVMGINGGNFLMICRVYFAIHSLSYLGLVFKSVKFLISASRLVLLLILTQAKAFIIY